MKLKIKDLKSFLVNHLTLTACLSWLLILLSIFYFGYICFWAAVDFNGFASVLFGIPVLLVLLVLSYIFGLTSEDRNSAGRYSKYISQLSIVLIFLYFVFGLFPSLNQVSDFPIKAITRLSKMCTGKTPQQWIKPVKNISN